ncbi:Vta1 like-domain-containing protein [Dissophora ornata]|nr:Vta1 like-domain-containing protein [Dissophora ornata]
MSASNLPEGLKSIGPYLQRAAQLQERDPVVSYYANYYAAKLAIPKAGQDNANRAFVVELLDTLEKQRKEIGDNEAISNDLVGGAHIENFALKIFSKADDEDRAGQGSQKTAKNFVAAANFLELLKVFGDIDSEVEEKIKYSKWRAAEIVKAIRDGRQPAPPPGAEKPREPSLSSTDMDAAGLESLDAGSTNSGGNVNSTTFSPAVIAPSVPSTTPQPTMGTGGGPGFPTISNFPSPPLEPSTISNNTFNGSINNNIGNNWNQPAVSPGLNQSQNVYSPTGAPGISQQPPSTFIPPAVSSPAPNSTTSNITSPNPNAQYGYGANNNLGGNFYQAPAVLPQPAPAPAQIPYSQPEFGAPSAPYQQPQQIPSPQPYAPVPMVLDPAVNSQVQKHCKWTVSALTYDDIPTAIDNLEKALALLRPYSNRQ